MPAIVISPYTGAHTVYHKRLDFRSVDLFIENTFNLPHLTNFKRGRRVTSMAPMLNLNQQPLAPVVLQTHACPARTPDAEGLRTFRVVAREADARRRQSEGCVGYILHGSGVTGRTESMDASLRE